MVTCCVHETILWHGAIMSWAIEATTLGNP